MRRSHNALRNALGSFRKPSLAQLRILISGSTLPAASLNAEIAGQLTLSVPEQDAQAISFLFRPAPPQNFVCSSSGSVFQCVKAATEYTPSGPIYSFTAGPVSGGFTTGQGFASAISPQPTEGIEIENSSLQPIVLGLLVTAVGQVDAQAGVMQFADATVSEEIQIFDCADVVCLSGMLIGSHVFTSSIDTRVNPGSPTPLGLYLASPLLFQRGPKIPEGHFRGEFHSDGSICIRRGKCCRSQTVCVEAGRNRVGITDLETSIEKAVE
jgi:hypothetical protein